MRRTSVVLLLSSLLLLQSAAAGDSKLGIGLNAGVQKPYCDVLHTGIAPAGEVMVRFLASDYLTLSLSVGGGVLSDGLSYYSYQTKMVTGDLKANLSLVKTGRIRPYLTVGASLYNFEYAADKPWAIGLANDGERFSSNAIIVGGGMEILTAPQFAVNLFADYRHTPTDLLDGAELGKAKDGYLNGRIGFTYYFGNRLKKAQPSEEDLIAQQLEDASLGENSEKMSKFEAKLDKLEAGDADMSMESYVRLKSRVDELYQLIDNKEKELEDLRAALDLKNKRIVDLETTLERGGTTGQVSVGEFSLSYEEALRLFYARRYREAISLFSALKAKYPDHPLVSNCHYWIGECHFGLQDYAQASEVFQGVFNWPNSLKRDDATLMLGRCFYNLRDTGRARSYFQGVIDDYPDSEYIEKARSWLQRIG